jgi:hypothetical protein
MSAGWKADESVEPMELRQAASMGCKMADWWDNWTVAHTAALMGPPWAGPKVDTMDAPTADGRDA